MASVKVSGKIANNWFAEQLVQEGNIVGWYSTTLTIEGYAVESEVHKGSVQIYPASALELVDDVTA